MADRIAKFLRSLTQEQRARILAVTDAIIANQFDNLDVKPLKGIKHTYRVRVGGYRVIFRTDHGGNVIVAMTKRDEQTYKNL